MDLKPMKNRLPTGEGSRGGKWHIKEYRLAYHRAWRAAHPEYRDKEKLRRAMKRAWEQNGNPAGTVNIITFPRPLPLPAEMCRCTKCLCYEEVVVVCGFCHDGDHDG